MHNNAFILETNYPIAIENRENGGSSPFVIYDLWLEWDQLNSAKELIAGYNNNNCTVQFYNAVVLSMI